MIEHLIINSLVIFGVHASTRDGMIFGFVAEFVTKGLMKLLTPRTKRVSQWPGSFIDDVNLAEVAAKRTIVFIKPLFDCPPCMASVWGIPFVLLHPLNIWSAVYLFALCGINYITMKLINR